MHIQKNIAQVREIYRPFFGAFFVLTLLVMCTQGLAMTTPYFYGKIIDGFISAKPVNEMLTLVSVMVGLLLTKVFFEFLRAYQHIEKLSFDVEKRIAEITLRSVMKFSLGQILNHNSGFKHDIIKKGESSLQEMVDVVVFDVIPVTLRITISMAGLFLLNVYLGLATLAGGIGYLIASVVINKRIWPALKVNVKEGNKINTKYWEILRYLRLVLISHQEEETIREYGKSYEVFLRRGKHIWRSYIKDVSIFRDPFNVVGQSAVLFTGIHLVHAGAVSPGNLVMAMAWSMFAFQAFDSVGSLQRRITRYCSMITRYFNLLEIPPAVTAVSNPIKLERVEGRIEFRGVSFEYPRFKSRNLDLDDDNKREDTDHVSPAIREVSFVIEPGTTCAFVGHSGAGKSTVINLLLRGYDPDNGQILIDGHDLRLIDLGYWRKSVGCVEQEPKLWDNTLRYNMIYGLNGAGEKITTEELELLARKTRIDEFYSRLGPERFETEIGENGVQLSGGQKQRVAIARAIAKSPQVLILDEATNALDPDNEQLIHQAIEDALVGRTGIIIAHRLSTIRRADQIIVFDDGRVVGNGKHEELMNSCHAYKKLVDREVGALA